MPEVLDKGSQTLWDTQKQKPGFPVENFSGEPAELTWNASWSFNLYKNFKIFKTHQLFCLF